MRRITHSKATIAIFVSMVFIMVVAMTASITLAAMSTYGFGSNTVYIANLGTISCTTSVSAKLYSGGTSDGTIHFTLAKGDNLVTTAKVTNFKLTSFTIKWGSNQSQTFSTGITNASNSATVTTTAGKWVFALNIGSGLELTAGTAKACTLSVTVPLGFDNSDAHQSVGGSPKDGYLVGTVTGVDCVFTIDVEPTAA